MKNKKKRYIPFPFKTKKHQKQDSSVEHRPSQSPHDCSFYDDYCDEKSDAPSLPLQNSSFESEKIDDGLPQSFLAEERNRRQRKSHVLVSPWLRKKERDSSTASSLTSESLGRYEGALSGLPLQREKKETIQDVHRFCNSFTFLCLLLILLFLGLTSLASASGYFALSKNLPIHYFVKRQALFAVMGLVIGLIVQPLPLSSLVKLCAFPFIILSYVLMFLTLFTPLGLDALGARRWISIGPLPSFQPSEVVKIATVFFLPLLLKTQRIKENIKDYLSLALILSFSLLILMQKDYSTAALYLAVSLVYAIVVGVSWKRLLKMIIFLPVPALGLLMSEQYRLLRIISFLHPSLDQQGINYQMANSLGALASGGIWGKGVGQGVYKLGRLPEVHNDFIISSIGEETGILGLAFICFLFWGFAYFGLKASNNERARGNMLSSDIILGFTLMIVFQVIVNLYVCIGLLPPTGIPLPFFSQGGTNLLLVLVESSLIYKSLREGEKV